MSALGSYSECPKLKPSSCSFTGHIGATKRLFVSLQLSGMRHTFIPAGYPLTERLCVAPTIGPDFAKRANARLSSREHQMKNSLPPPAKPAATTVKLKELRTCHEGVDTQFRVERDETTVLRYAEAMKRGDKFPPIDVMATGAGSYYIVDGWHRAAAAESIGRRTISARVYLAPTEGDPLVNAQRMALEANTKHGLPLTTGDQLKRAHAILQLPENAETSLRKLEIRYGIGKSTFGRVRRELITKGLLPEWQTGDTLPAFVPTEYAHFNRAGKRGNPVCWDHELREEVFAFVSKLQAASPREWKYVLDDQDVEDGGAEDHWGGHIEHHGLVVDHVVIFSPFPPNRVVKGMPKERRVVDPLREPATPEQKAAWEEAKRRREIEAAWQRLRGHPNRSLMPAIQTLQRLAAQQDLKADLQTVLWEIVRPRDAFEPPLEEVDEDEILAGFLGSKDQPF